MDASVVLVAVPRYFRQWLRSGLAVVSTPISGGGATVPATLAANLVPVPRSAHSLVLLLALMEGPPAGAGLFAPREVPPLTWSH